ncbi:adenosylcobinamide-GDP ribazoletransferase [Neptunomonas phycophila]|uniref:adenosylcobinamide-GDP ribazoletransferase n=1 Tax=Neptunomonas phycophila TaxID=1572645 RepID=UPI000948A6FB|nr:adenosylcobinamide-GDP ribazoletransferase [Neptunomonas phycophila]
MKPYLLAHVNAFLAATQFLTLLPVPVRLEWTLELQRRALLYYPAVGLVLGCLLVLAHAISTWAFAAHSVVLPAAVTFFVWVALTGALHLDGLADAADGWMGGLGDREKTLRIMKDPCVGVTGAVVLILVCLMKFAALANLMESGKYTHLCIALLVAPLLARVAVMCLLVTTPYVRAGGIASSWIEHITPSAILWPLVCAVIGALWLSPLALVISAAVLWMCRRVMLNRLQGTTGDTAGATIELIELAILLGMNTYIAQ